MKWMTAMLVALFLVPLIYAEDGALVGDSAAGKKAWDARRCLNCHGKTGQGGYGPDLAGRQLTFAQYKHAVRKPWGMMPTFSEAQISDRDLANVRAYLTGLPTVAEPEPWDVPLPPPSAPLGQVLLISYGCGQCHDSELRNPREALGGIADISYDAFSKFVYNHSDTWRTGRMGDFSRARLPEMVLKEIFRFATQDLGLIPPVAAAIADPVPDGPNTSYKLLVKNRGVKGRGLSAEDVTIKVALAPGTKVVSGTGTGYQGVQNDPKLNHDYAVWKVPSVGPGETQIYGLTIAGKGGPPAELFKHSFLFWMKPVLRPGIVNLDDLEVDTRGELGVSRIAETHIYLDRPVSENNEWLGGAIPPGVCDNPASARRGAACGN